MLTGLFFRGLLKYYGISHKLHASQNHLPSAHNPSKQDFHLLRL